MVYLELRREVRKLYLDGKAVQLLGEEGRYNYKGMIKPGRCN